MAEPTRLRLLVLLASGELSVKDLTGILGQSQPRISRHLKLLAEAGLVERAPEGSWVYFRLAEGGEGGALARLVLEAVDRADPMLVARPAARRSPAGGARAGGASLFPGPRRRMGQHPRAACGRGRGGGRRRGGARARPVRSASSTSAPARGACSSCLRERYRRGLGIDLSPAMLAYARAKLERTGLRARAGAAGRHLRSAARRPGRRRRGDAPGAALPERPAARRARGGARAGAGRAPADRRFRPARAGVPARAVCARAPGLRRASRSSNGWPIAGSSWCETRELASARSTHGDGQAHGLGVAGRAVRRDAATAADDAERAQAGADRPR